MTSRRMLGLGALLVLVTGCAPSSGFWDRSPKVAGVRRSAARPAPRRAPQRAPQPAPRATPSQPTSPPSQGGTYTPSRTGPTQEDFAVLDRVNQIRRARGLQPFTWCSTIWRAAYDHSMEQHVHGYMGHGSPDPRRERLAQRMQLAGYDGRLFGEVVAWNYRTVEGVVRGWMNSPSHRSILLDRKMTEAAFSRVGMYWTGNFGLPRPVVRWRQVPPRRRGTSAPAPEPKAEPRAWSAPADDMPRALPALPEERPAPTQATPRVRTVRRVGTQDIAPRAVRITPEPVRPLPPPPAARPQPREYAPAPEPAPAQRPALRAREQGSCYVPPANPPPSAPRGPAPRGSG
ncbi:MAG: CAP domain-containing protein [Planctomycetota bacterium]